MSSVEVIDFVDIIDIIDEAPVDQMETAPMAKASGAPGPRRPVLPPASHALGSDVSEVPSGSRVSAGRIALATAGVLLAILILLGVLAGNLFEQVFNAPSSSWLDAALEAGPVAAVLCGALAAVFGYSAHRQAERHASTSTPPVWQLATATLLLVASLAVTGFTLAPAPFHLLGASLASSSSATTSTTSSSGNSPSNTSLGPVVSPVPVVTATPQPTPAVTPTPAPHLAAALSTTALRQTCPGFYSALPPATVTLDNSASSVDAQWQVTYVQLIPGTPHPFVSTAMSGDVPAGGQATLTFTPHPKLCYWNPLPGKVYHLTLSIAGGPTTNITDTITSPKL
ncbi:MAG TPA: hypothetical protein VF120_04160 [Ktedonobacterales bacterium]